MKRKDKKCAKRNEGPAVFIRAAGLDTRRKSGKPVDGKGAFPEQDAPNPTEQARGGRHTRKGQAKPQRGGTPREPPGTGGPLAIRIFTDYKNLEYFMTTKKLTRR
jgi:hypothetical protein